MAKVRRRERRHKALQALREQLERPEGTAFAVEEGIHSADLADVLWLDFEPDEARRLFRELPSDLASEVIAEAEPQLAERLLGDAEPAFVAELLDGIPADDGTDILEVLDEDHRQKVLHHVEPQGASELRHLGAYEADTAGGLMTTEVVSVRPDEHVGDVLKRLRRGEGEEAETIHNIYVVQDGALQGVLSTRELLEANIHQTAGEIANPDVIQARVDDDQEEVAHRILHYNLSAIPVVDARGQLLGIVTADDALEVLEEEGSEDVLLLAGAGSTSIAAEPLHVKVMHRAPMLAVTVAAGLLMSRVMNLLVPDAGAGDSSEAWVTILSYIPMVLALSGTIGTQTSAVIVRGFAVGQIPPGRRVPVFVGEVKVGATLGLIASLVAFPMATLFASGDWRIGFSLSWALFLAMTWTATAATSIAMGSEAAGFDPALVSGPVMMAVSDLSSVLLFFGVAQFMLES